MPQSKIATETDTSEKPTDRGESRSHVRIPVRQDAEVFKLDEGFKVLGNCDISEAGVAFLSDHKFETGRRLRLNIQNTIWVEIVVMNCEMVMIDEVFMEAKYRVGTRFYDGPLDKNVYQMVIESFSE